MYVPPHVMQKLVVVDLELKKYNDQLTATEQSGDKDAAAKTLKDMVETEGEHTVSLDSVEGPSALSHAARANVSNKCWHSEKLSPPLGFFGRRVPDEGALFAVASSFRDVT